MAFSELEGYVPEAPQLREVFPPAGRRRREEAFLIPRVPGSERVRLSCSLQAQLHPYDTHPPLEESVCRQDENPGGDLGCYGWLVSI